MKAISILKKRGVTRLCHFTKFKSLVSILPSKRGIEASTSICWDVFSPNDIDRYDGERDHVCCSIQYPNIFYFGEVLERDEDEVFTDWVVIYIGLDVLEDQSAKFCPCNASKEGGKYIQDGMDQIGSIFGRYVCGFKRDPNMVRACPTNLQAEILIKDNVPREFIRGIAVENENMASRVYAVLKMDGLLDIEVFVVPDIFSKTVSDMLKKGNEPDEAKYTKE